MSRLASIALLFLFLPACASSQSDFGPNARAGGGGDVDASSGWERAAQTVFGTLDNVEFEHNETGNYVLATLTKPVSRRQPDPIVDFLVYDVRNETTTVQEQITGQVRWWGPQHILVQTVPGIVSNDPRVDDRTYNYTINVATGIRSRGSEIPN